MQMDRNENPDGKGKYALVRMRGIKEGDEAYSLLSRLAELGHVDWGSVGSDDEFFVIKLKDQFAFSGLVGYGSTAVDSDPEWAHEVLELAQRAYKHPNKKKPD